MFVIVPAAAIPGCCRIDSSKRSRIPTRSCIKLPREGELAGENMIGAKAGRNGHHLFQAQPEQRRTSEQDKSERDLRDDKAVAKALRGATDRAGARFRLKRIRKMAAKIEPGDRHRDHDSEKNRADEPDRGEPAIERDLRAERQTIRTENLEQLNSPRAHHQRRAIHRPR